nr:MAG TPA: Erythromycin resistance leader peptide [Caudoviricetes sp.]
MRPDFASWSLFLEKSQILIHAWVGDCKSLISGRAFFCLRISNPQERLTD